MADPVSWFLIEPGWKVLAADGSEIGAVKETTGDSNADIFDGLAITTGAGKPRYVPAEQVEEMTDGTVRLKLSPVEVDQLGEYEEPPESARIEPDIREDSFWERLRSVFRRPSS